MHRLLQAGEYDQVAEALETTSPIQAGRAWLSALHPAEAAQIIRRTSQPWRMRALLCLEPRLAARVIEALPDDVAARTVSSMEPQEAAVIVQEMHTDEEADLLQRLDPLLARNLLERVVPDDAAIARRLMEHDRETAGGLMQAEFIAIPRGMRVGDVVRQLQDRSEVLLDD